MLRTLLVCGAALIAGVATAQTNDPEAAFASVLAEYERIDRLADPITAGQEGDREALRRLPDARQQADQQRRRELEALGKRLLLIDARQLSAESALNHSLLSRGLPSRLRSRFDLSRIAFQNDDGFHTLGDYLARTTTIASRDDADAWLARLEALPTFYEQNIANLRRGVQTHYTQPRIVVDRVLDVARKQADSETGRQLAAAAVCAHAREHSGRGAGRSIASARCGSFAIAFCRRSASSPSFWRATMSPAARPAHRLAHDAQRRGELSLPGAPRDDDEHDAG